MYICRMMNEWNRLDLYEKSNNDIMIELGRRFRDYRIALRMTQKEIALQSGVSVMTIVRFEKGEGRLSDLTTSSHSCALSRNWKVSPSVFPRCR